MKRMIVIGALVALCAVAALTSANAKEPAANSRLKEMVAARMASPKGMTENDVPKGKVTLRMATPAGKYAQNGDVQNFGLNDDREEALAQLEEAKKQKSELQKEIDKLAKELGIQVDSRDSSDPNANAIKWYKPTNLKDNSSSTPGPGGSPGTVLPPGSGGWFDGIDPLCWCDCCCYPCPPIYPYGVFDDGCGCNSYEMGCGFVDDCSCSLDCDVLCESGRLCRVRSAIGRVVSRVGALR